MFERYFKLSRLHPELTLFNRHDNLFTLLDNASHSACKKDHFQYFLQIVYFKLSYADRSMRDVLFGRYLLIINQAAIEGKPIEVLDLNYSLSMDIFVQ